MGWPYPFRARPWEEIEAEFAELGAFSSTFAHMLAIVESVRCSGVVDRLAAFTSMHDLMVTAQPIPELPYDLVAVRAPDSLHPPAKGTVLIEHLAVTGRNDRIERPVGQAVPLFWRFMIEKYGVCPAKERGTPE